MRESSINSSWWRWPRAIRTRRPSLRGSSETSLDTSACGGTVHHLPITTSSSSSSFFFFFSFSSCSPPLSYRQDGYDPYCKLSFRAFLVQQYQNSISQLNYNWRSNYNSFEEVKMPLGYNRSDPSWADLVQWRKSSIAGFLAAGAAKIHQADPNHM